MDKNILRKLSYGVYAIGIMDGERPTGCIANSVMQITSSPMTLAISMNHDNYTHGCMEKNEKFSVSVLTEKTEPKVIGVLGFQSGRNVNKFEEIEYRMVEGAPVVSDSCGYLICKVIDKMETTTHTVFLAEVLEGELCDENKEMTYAYYHQVVKGSSPKNAPTYIAEEKVESKNEVYVCPICGYEYTGEVPFEELPEDWVCPICLQPKSEFKKKE